MAHLLVSMETVIRQENPVQGRGKLKRSPSDVSSALVASASKRRALATITNRPLSRECQATKPTTTNQLIVCDVVDGGWVSVLLVSLYQVE